jgi:fibronectin-binding autotransporter adhesin
VALLAGGTVTNQGTAALIAGGNFGVDGTTIAATVINDGTITASGNGVYLAAGGAVTNTGTAALISGYRYGVFGAGSAAPSSTTVA